MGFLKRNSKKNLQDPSGQKQQRWSMKGLMGKVKAKKNIDFEGVMVIGIDFGTTYSGVAWATQADFESQQIKFITTWPDAQGDQGKTPTEIEYNDGKTSWGFGIDHEADPIRWFKLLLLNDEDMDADVQSSDYIRQARKRIKQEGKNPVDVISDYLAALWKHIIFTIEKDRSKTVVDGLRFHVVITVPAIWKDYARAQMTEAVTRAGILEDRMFGKTTLDYAIEPEAAAMATLYERNEDIQIDDVYVICDAGGGTVDLISYKVGQVEPIELQEAVVGIGGLCGGIFIDDAFENIVRSRLGRHWNKLSPIGIKEIMKNEWEYNIKKKFDPCSDNEYIMPVPHEAMDGSNLNEDGKKPKIANGRIHFTSANIKKAFEEPFNGIGSLVDKQIKAAKDKSLKVKAVILVGGLGSSSYLYTFLLERYKSKNIDILQAAGNLPRTAICRGAVYKGFLDREELQLSTKSPIRVTSTIARTSLGVTFSEPFQEGMHDEEDKAWDPIEGGWCAHNQMRWYLTKGDDVSKASPVRNSFYTPYESEEEFMSGCEHAIMQCDDDNPPSRVTGRVKQWKSIDCRVDHIRYTSLEKDYGVDGQEIRRMHFEIEMVPSGAANEFSVYHEGKKLGSRNGLIEV